MQAIALSYGVWISQSIVRRSAADGGGHGNPVDGYEILHTNIGGVLDALGLSYESFSSDRYPQSNEYLEWMKRQLARGHSVVWFIMCKGDSHNSYNIPNATYDHVEPVFGIYSDDLEAPVSPRDVLVHGSNYAPDGSLNLGYFRQFDSLVDTTKMSGNCSNAQSGWGKNEMYPCLDDEHSFGVALTGLARGPTLPISITMNSIDEPFNPAGYLFATVAVSNLEPGLNYLLYRFDRGNEAVPASATDYHHYADWVLSFCAHEDEDPQGNTFVWFDSNPIASNTTVAYRAIQDDGAIYNLSRPASFPIAMKRVCHFS